VRVMTSRPGQHGAMWSRWPGLERQICHVHRNSLIKRMQRYSTGYCVPVQHTHAQCPIAGQL
jgi:hypothetical protein